VQEDSVLMQIVEDKFQHNQFRKELQFLNTQTVCLENISKANSMIVLGDNK